MLISASYKTDIPTFYGEWFIRRLRTGYCKTVNPFNKRISRVSLKPDDVGGFVFWTKNIGPFMKQLREVNASGYPFVVQHTVNGYPRTLEHSVVDATKAVENVHAISEAYGCKVAVWRYDTIVLTSLTSREFHLRTFERLARSLEGATDEVVISFAHVYRKTKRNMDAAAVEYGFEWSDPTDEWKRSLTAELVAIASTHNMQLTVCSQPQFAICGGQEARCIDVRRLEAVAGRPLSAKTKGNRPECLCSEAKDIGEYDTCPHGCVYCYAVQNRSLAQQRFREHDPDSEFLFRPPADASETDERLTEEQRSLFDQ